VILCFPSCRDSDSDPISEIEEEAGVTTRIYDIEISSTDASGNTGSKVCSVIVVPEGHYDSTKGSLSKKSKKGQKRRLKGRGKRVSNDSDSKSSSKSKSDSGHGEEPHNPDDLRDELALSTQRFKVASLTLLWDPELDTDLVAPPLPEPREDDGGKGKGGKGKGSKRRQA
jgi:hypothetical protein